MPNTREKEKLTDIVCDAMEDGCIGHCNHPPCFQVERVVNALIANGVTVQEDCKACAEATQNCIVKLQEQIAELSSVQEWISVKDRLPEDTCNVIAHCLSGCICSILYIKNIGFEDAGMRVFVTHWMPLPQPPKGE